MACASRNGVPFETSHSARSVAAAVGAFAASAMTSSRNVDDASRPVIAPRARTTVSSESKRGSLSSWRSRLYASGSALSVARSPVRLPMSRPVLPRVSSAISGFFFCGSMEEPVEYASARPRKPNSSVDHRMISSARRDKWTPRSAKSKSDSATKSRSLTASSELANTPANPRSLAAAAGSSGNDEPASAPAPRGETSSRRRVSINRSMSRERAHPCARRW